MKTKLDGRKNPNTENKDNRIDGGRLNMRRLRVILMLAVLCLVWYCPAIGENTVQIPAFEVTDALTATENEAWKKDMDEYSTRGWLIEGDMNAARKETESYVNALIEDGFSVVREVKPGQLNAQYWFLDEPNANLKKAKLNGIEFEVYVYFEINKNETQAAVMIGYVPGVAFREEKIWSSLFSEDETVWGLMFETEESGDSEDEASLVLEEGTSLQSPLIFFEGKYVLSHAYNENFETGYNWRIYYFNPVEPMGKEEVKKDTKAYLQALIDTGYFAYEEGNDFRLSYVGEKEVPIATSNGRTDDWNVLVKEEYWWQGESDYRLQVNLVDGFVFKDIPLPIIEEIEETEEIPQEPVVIEENSYNNSSSGSTLCITCSGDGRVDERCSSCSGSGDRSCISCAGKGYDNCSGCYGSGDRRCGRCYGTGTDGKNRCSNCYGSGEVRCSSCSGSGRRNCSACSGSGDRDCSSCGGDGRQERSCSSCGGDGRR